MKIIFLSGLLMFSVSCSSLAKQSLAESYSEQKRATASYKISDFKVGDPVVYSFNDKTNLDIIVGLNTKDDRIILEKAGSVLVNYVFPLVLELGDLNVSQSAVFNFNNKTELVTILAISERSVLLGNGNWTLPSHLQPLVQDYKGIKVGDKVKINFNGTITVGTMELISSERCRVNGRWVLLNYVEKI